MNIMDEWFKLSEEDRRLIFQQVSNVLGLPATAIEKDWWATLALSTIFKTDLAPYLVFKGGTSLNKAWKIIERFSEDIDLALDRKFLGFAGELPRKAVTRLRKASCQFIDGEFLQILSNQLSKVGVKDYKLSVQEYTRSDTDPLIIQLEYKSLTDSIDYLRPRILIEISSRAPREPFEYRDIISYVSNNFQGQKFSDEAVKVPSVLPSRTLIEKMFLLHEEFQKPQEREIRSQRMSRHLYDISKIMDTEFKDQGLNDRDLYNSIIRHREMLTNISWVDYSSLKTSTLNFIPPDSIIDEYRIDYLNMQENMIYGKSDPFEEIISKLQALNNRINKF